jgi:hypothetical protein
VTQCRAPLDYYSFSGALNEAFSDIVATAMEWQVNEPTTSNCRRQTGQSGCPDWWIGEDILIGGPDFGFRNIADPESAGQPGHWADRYKFSGDNAGVHFNSTIPSHAFYLMVNGGRNARCEGALDGDLDCDVVVPPISMADATEIMYAAWGTLTSPTNNDEMNAMFCNAHDATVAIAEELFPGSDAHRAGAELAWAAVGRGQLACHPNSTVWFPARSIALAPGGSGSLDVELAPAAEDLALAGNPPPGTSLNGQAVEFQVPVDQADGVYPVVVSASNGSTTSYASAVLIVDATAPVAAVEAVHLPTSGQLTRSGTMGLGVAWTAIDATSGLSGAVLQSHPNTATYANVASGNGGISTVTVGADDYWFQVVATDAVDNEATSAESGPWTVGHFQEGAGTYKGAWSTLPATQNWGSVRFASVAGATAKFTFTGSEVAWISTGASNRGKAKVYLDGVLKAKVDLYSATTSARRIAFVASGISADPHTLKIIVSGTSGRPRVDIDGFVVLGQPSP